MSPLPAALALVLLAAGAAAPQEPASGGEAQREEARGREADAGETAEGTPGERGAEAPGRPDDEPPPPETLPPPLPPLAAELSAEAFAPRLRGLAERFPGLVRPVSLGRSAGGREILAVAITDAETGFPGTKPALLVLGERDGGAAAGGAGRAELVLGLARELASELAASAAPGGGEGGAAWARRATLLVAPLLDPDAHDAFGTGGSGPGTGGPGAEGAEPPWRTALFERSFPFGWRPEALRPGSGRYPLARPEALAVARFLDEHPELVVVLGVAELGPSGIDAEAQAGGTDAAAADRAALGALEIAVVGARARAWSGPPSGTPLDHAYLGAGLFPAAWAPTEGEASFEARVASLASLVRALLERLPYLALDAGEPERLGGEQWRLDLVVANAGALPTSSERAREARPERELVLTVRGARLVAAAVREAGRDAFRPLAPVAMSVVAASEPGEPAEATPEAGGVPVGGRLRLGSLAGGGHLELRLVLETPDGAEVELAVSGAWVAEARAGLVLR